MDIKSFVKDSAAKERSTHYISNIMMTAVLGLIIIFTLCFGVKANIGSAFFADGGDAYVRQSIFKVADVVLNSNMSDEEAVAYVERVNQEMLEEYGVLGLEIRVSSTANDGASVDSSISGYDNLGDFKELVDDLGSNASKLNLLKYKLAYAIAMSDATSTEHKLAYDGHRVFAMSGQLILVAVAQLAVLIIALTMLAFAIIALVKKRENGKMRFAFILLSLCALFNIMMFSGMSFVCMNWAGIMVIALTFLGAICLALIRHALMDKRDFSFTMLVHNGVLFAGVIIALSLYLSPIFKMTNDAGVTTNVGWAYMSDYRLAVMAYMSAVMAYTLSYVITLIMFLLPAVLLIVLMLTIMARFMAADYQLNDKRVMLIMLFVISLIEFAMFASFSSKGSLNVTDLYITVKLNVVPLIMGLLSIGGLIAFEILYKVKPVKKELVIR